MTIRNDTQKDHNKLIITRSNEADTVAVGEIGKTIDIRKKEILLFI